MARHRPPAKPFSVTMLLTMGFGSMAVLGGMVWLALAYEHAALLAVLLPVLPVIFSFFIEQCRNTMEEWREDDEDFSGGTAHMTPYSLLYLLIMVLVVILVCVIIVYAVEQLFGPIDRRIKGLAGLIVLLLLLLYILGHTGVLGGRW